MEPVVFLEIANRELAEERLARRPDWLRAVQDVFDDPDPNASFIAFAKRYIGKPRHDVRVADINNLKWSFGIADRSLLTQLLRWKGVIGPRD